LRQRTGRRQSGGFPSWPSDPGILSCAVDWQQRSKGIHQTKEIKGVGTVGGLTLVSQGALLGGWGLGKSNEKKW